MGQAVITGITDASLGKYSCRLVKHPGRSVALLAAIEKELDVLNSTSPSGLIPTAEAAVDAAMIALTTALTALNVAIAAGIEDDITKATEECVTRNATYMKAQRTLSDLLFKDSRLKTEQAMLTSAMADDERELWCADKTTTLTVGQTVGTMEMNGETTAIIITPGGATASALGLIEPVGVSSPSATFWNWAVMPGWQKWKPTYRLGTVVSVDWDNDTCDIALDPVFSSVTV